MTSSPIILIWRDEAPLGRRCLRGVKCDGSFYGTFELYDLGRCGNLEGQLTDAENVSFHRLAARIRDSADRETLPDNAQEWEGLLAIGPFNSPDKTVVFHKRKGDELSSDAIDFLALVALMRPYVEAQIQESIRNCLPGK